MGEPLIRPESEPLTSARQRGLPGASEIMLRRLLAVATLTPAQTGVLTLDLAEAVGAHRSPSPTRVDGRNTYVTTAGRLRLVTGPTGEDDKSAPTPTLATPDHLDISAAAVVRELRTNLQRSGHDADELHMPEDQRDPTALADRLRTAGLSLLADADSGRVERVRAEVGALAAMLRQPVASPSTGARPAAGGWPASTGRAWHRRGLSLPGRTTLIIVLLVAIGLAAWWAIPRLGPDLQREWNALFSAEPPPRIVAPVGSPPPPPAEDTPDDSDGDLEPAAVEPAAPEAAGPVTGVSVEPEAGACTPGQECLVRVQVDLERAGTTRRVEWSIEIVDRCTEEVTTRPGVTVNAQPGWSQVWGNTLLELPAGTALAVVAVTASPANAASPPLLLPADGSC